MTREDFIAQEKASLDTIDFKRIYVDIAAKDLVAGLLLSQIIYWFLPNARGKRKLRVYKDKYYWLAKKRQDWWEECRITPNQFDRAIKVLEKQRLVITRIYRFSGSPTKHILLHWTNFLEQYEKALEKYGT